MKISKALNLVIPVETDKGTIYIHSTPISREVFEQYYRVIGKTFSQILMDGLNIIAGPRIAYLLLRDTAVAIGQWEDVEKGLVNEIIRLTNVAISGEKGWEQMPLHTAFQRQLLTDDDISVIKGELIFFILSSVSMPKADVEEWLRKASSLWGSQITLLNFTDYMTTLPILTEDASSGGMAIIASLPS